MIDIFIGCDSIIHFFWFQIIAFLRILKSEHRYSNDFGYVKIMIISKSELIQSRISNKIGNFHANFGNGGRRRGVVVFSGASADITELE